MENSKLLTRAVIPTNSLFLIGREENNIDDMVQFLRASGTTLKTSDRSQPQRWVRVYEKRVKTIELRYNRNTTREKFDSAGVTTAIRYEGFADVWVHELRLRLKVKAAPYDFIFKNQPLTAGSEAARYAMTYLTELLRQGWIKKIQARHLPLIEVLTVPRGGHLSPDDISDPVFIAWLNKTTNGLVKLKTVRKVSGDTYVDVAIRDENLSL